MAPLIPRKTTVVRGYLDDRVPFPATGETTVGKRFFLFFFFFYYDEARIEREIKRGEDSIYRFLIGEVRVLLLRWREERKGICFFLLLLIEIIIIFDEE